MAERDHIMRRTLAVVAVGVLSLLFVSCGQDDDAGGGANGERVELTFWHGYTEADGDVLEKMVEDFNASQDGVSIKTEIKPWAVIDDTLLTSLSAGKGPDIVAMPAERLPVYADKGAFVSLDDLYEADDSNAAALNPGAVDMVTVSGTHYGVPTGFVPLAMFYNKALFKEAGIKEPPATWDEWIATAKELTLDENGDGKPEQYGLGLPDHATVANGVWPTLFYGNGGQIVEDGTTAVIDSPENAETLALWRDAVVEDKISPVGLDGIAGDGLFSSGKAAMYLGGPWMSSISEENKIDYGIAPVPAGPVERAASAIGVSMAVTDQGEEGTQQAAEEFFRYFLDRDQSIEWSLGSGWPPLRTDVSASEVSENPVVAALTEQTELGRPLLPGVVNSTDVLAAVDELTQRAMAGEDIPDLLAEAQASIQSTLDEQ
jgi:multiple sugar transport system substrate-binding protein